MLHGLCFGRKPRGTKPCVSSDTVAPAGDERYLVCGNVDLEWLPEGRDVDYFFCILALVIFLLEVFLKSFQNLAFFGFGVEIRMSSCNFLRCCASLYYVFRAVTTRCKPKALCMEIERVDRCGEDIHIGRLFKCWLC